MISKQADKNYQTTVQTWQSVFADPINFLDVFEKGSSYNTSGYRSSKYDSLLDQSENTFGNQPEKRWHNLVEAEKTLMNDQGPFTVPSCKVTVTTEKMLKNVVYNPVRASLTTGRQT